MVLQRLKWVMARFIAPALLLLVAAACPAQRSMTGATSRLMISMMPDAKKELKVTKDQDKKIQEAVKTAQKEIEAGTRQIDLSDPMGSMDIDFEPIFTEPQRSRLEELFIQANSGYALTDPKVAAALALTDEQREKAATAKSDATLELIKLMGEMRTASAMKAMKKRHIELGDKMLEILTADQKTKLETLKGKPFKFKT